MKPNILLVTIDSLRTDHLSVYGYNKPTSPNLEQFSTESVTFNNAISPAAWTGASIASILTGLYPVSHGYTNSRYYLDDKVETLTRILQSQGYDTGMFSNNIYISDKTGLTQGFNNYYYRGKRIEAKQKNHNHVRFTQSLPLWSRFMLKDIYDLFNKHRALSRDDGAFDTENAFFRFIKEYDNSNPFFVYIHYQEPHSIYFPPKPFRRQFSDMSWLRDYAYLYYDHIGYFGGKKHFSTHEMDHYKSLYDGEIAYLDYRLGRLIEFLRQRKILDQTLVIITADHGECMGENGYIWHAFCIQEPLIRVPLLVRYPEWFPNPRISNELVQTNDIMPTILEGLGVDWNYKNESHGKSFLNGCQRNEALIQYYNPEMMIDRWLERRHKLEKQEFKQYCRDLIGYRTLEKKFVLSSDGRHEYYNIETDSKERQNLYNKQSSECQRLEKRVTKWNETLTPHVADDKRTGFDKKTWEKMKALGYA